MANAIIEDAMSETGHDLAAIIRAGCFVNEAASLARSGANAAGRQPAIARRSGDSTVSGRGGHLGTRG